MPSGRTRSTFILLVYGPSSLGPTPGSRPCGVPATGCSRPSVKNPRPGAHGSARQVRANVARVALGATLRPGRLRPGLLGRRLVVVDRFDDSVDSRLATRLQPGGTDVATRRPKGDHRFLQPTVLGDFDDAPIVLWWVAPEATSALRLDTNAPALPRTALGVAQPTDATVGGREFRLTGEVLSDGRLIAGTTAQQVRTARPPSRRGGRARAFSSYHPLWGGLGHRSFGGGSR